MKRAASPSLPAPPTRRSPGLARALAAHRAAQRGAKGVPPTRADVDALADALRVESAKDSRADITAIRSARAALGDALAAVVGADAVDVEEAALVDDIVRAALADADKGHARRAREKGKRDVVDGKQKASLTDVKQEVVAHGKRRAGASSSGEKEGPARLPSFRLNRTRGSPLTFSYTMRDHVVTQHAKLCVIINFLIDPVYLLHTAPEIFTADRIIIVHGMDNTVLSPDILQSVLGPAAARVSIVRPHTPAYGTMHAKARLTFCTEGCRVSIHTANDIECDWQQRCQGAWMRDFPRKKDGTGATPFENDLADFLRALGVPDAALELCGYDFESAGAALVTSVPGKHTNARYGHAALRRLLENEKFAHDSNVVFNFSSLGSIRPAWLQDEFEPAVYASAGQPRHRRLQLVLPTVTQVAKSNESYKAGESLPVRAKNVHREHIRNRLCVWNAGKSGRSRAMPHIKTMLRYTNDARIEWLYLGSANLSGAAWGWMRKNGNLDILSFEIGVLLIPSIYTLPVFNLGGGVPTPVGNGPFRFISAFQHYPHHPLSVRLPLPYSLPPESYTRADVPWHVDFGIAPECGDDCKLLRAAAMLES